MGLLVIFVKPNHFKPIITEQVQKATGKALVFTGDLSWKFWPHLGFGFQGAEFGAENNFGNLPLAKIDHAIVGIQIKPLFSKKIMVSELSIKNLVMNFVKNKQGVTNWQTLKIPTKKADLTTEKTPSKISGIDFELRIPGIYTDYLRVNWVNLGNRAQNVFQARGLKATVTGDQNAIKINPIYANLYGGNFTGNISINLKTKTVNSNTNFNNINIQSFLADLSNYNKITGTGGLTTQLTLYNFDFNKNNGTVKFYIKNGVIKFLNITKLIEIGYKIKQGNVLALRDLSGLGQTEFGDLTGNATLQNNFVSIQSIHLSSDKIEGEGSGTINLNTFQSNIRISAWLKARKDDVIPIIISGDIRHPSVRPDQTALLKLVVKHQGKQIKEVVQKQLGKALGKLFG